MKNDRLVHHVFRIIAIPFYQISPTLKPCANFDASADCEKLRKAMKGLGTDEQAIIDVMAHRSNAQRVKIVLQFKTMYGKDLIKEFESELSGKLLQVVEGLCYTPEEFDALQLRKATKGLGTDEDALIEILCTRTNEQIQKIKEAYYKGIHQNTDQCFHFVRDMDFRFPSRFVI